MKITAKVCLALCLVFLIVLTVIAAFLAGHNERYRIAIETERARRTAQRLRDLVDYQADNLLAYTVDMAHWDDTFAFMNGEEPDESYLRRNLPDEAMAIDGILFFDDEGRLFHGEALRGADETFLASFSEALKPYLVVAGGEEQLHAGLLRSDRTVAFVAVAPIKRSDGRGESRGTLALIRLADEVGALTRRLAGLDVTFSGLDGDDGSGGAAPPDTLSFERKDGVLRATTFLEDLKGRPVFEVSMAIDGDLRERHQKDFFRLVVALVIAFLALLAVVFIFIDNLVLKRLKTMQAEMKEIAHSPLLQGSLTVTGSDELADLARHGNDLIAALVRASNRERQANQLFSSLVDNIPGVVYRSRDDANWTREYLNGSFEEITGYAVTDFLLREDRSFSEIVHPEDRTSLSEGVERSRERGEPFTLSYRIVRPDGTVRFVLDKGQFLYDPTTSRTCFDGVIFDITDQVEGQRQLARSEARFRALFLNSPLALFEIDGSDAQKRLRALAREGDLRAPLEEDPDGVWELLDSMTVLQANARGLSLLGAPDLETLNGRKRDIGRDLERAVQIERLLALAEGKSLFEAEEIFHSLDGRRLVAHGRWVLLPEQAGELGRILFALEDITERKELEERLRHLSFHDALTGLFNRTFFESQTELFEDGRFDPLAVVSIDVDKLKLVNDTLGHGAGDELLGRAAAVLKKVFRDSDVVARVGGDEFAVLLPHCTASGLKAVLGRLDAVLTDAEEEGLAPLLLSVGWAWREGGEKTLARLFADADDAMYQAKAARSGQMAARFRENVETLLEERDRLGDGHEERLRLLLKALAEGLGLDGQEGHALSLLARYHDLGKVAATADAPLRHAEAGARLARAWPDLAFLAEAIESHHERWDGTGYPRGLAGEAIPREARILAVALAYEAGRTGRKSPRRSREEMTGTIRLEAGRAFDPAVVDAFLSCDLEALERDWPGFH